MTGQNEPRASAGFSFYGPQYTRFASPLAVEMRREVYGEDNGQQGWRTAAEQAEIADLLGLRPDSRVLDVACGAGGPSMALVERTGCRLVGLDVEAAGAAWFGQRQRFLTLMGELAKSRRLSRFLYLAEKPAS